MKFYKEDIDLLLENSQIESSDNYQIKANVKRVFEVNSDKENDVKFDISDIDFVNKQINCVRKLFIQYSSSDKNLCIDYLNRYLDGYNGQIASVAFNALVHIGSFDKVFKSITSNFNNSNQDQFYFWIFKVLTEILMYEWKIFTKDQVDNMYLWIREVKLNKNKLGEVFKWKYTLQLSKPFLEKLYRQLNIIKTFRLEEQVLNEYSQEITDDTKALKLEFKRFNFPTDINEALDKINTIISTAGDNFDYQHCMGLICSFSERLYKHIAETIDPSNGSKMDEKVSEEVAKFFVKNKLISEDQGKLLISIRHFLSNEGVHRLKSRPDDARLSRNLMIELGLYLMLRVKDINTKV